MALSNPDLRRRFASFVLAAGFFCGSGLSNAMASPALAVDVGSGAVLYQQEAARPWYPASLTKLMTLYVALKAVSEHRLSFDTPLVVSARATAMPPSKMGLRPGTQVTLGNALKMMIVKSANDIAITVAEGVSGSVEAFADEMNDAAGELGLTQSHFVNPNGLPDDRHFSSARDMAILARALYLRFPDQGGLFGIGALRLGDAIITNHNNLLGRYPGAEGMKTGFTCAAGFNIVASAEQGGRKLIVVILGSPNVEQRTLKAAALFDRGFAGIDRPSVPVTGLAAETTGAAPDIRKQACGNRSKALAQSNAEIEQLMAPLMAATNTGFASQPEHAVLFDGQALARAVPMAARIKLVPRPVFDPVPIFVGAAEGYAGPVAQARLPHSPIGTETAPVTASAYAAAAKLPFEGSGTPLAPDVGALPLKGHAARALLKPAAPHEAVAQTKSHKVAAISEHAKVAESKGKAAAKKAVAAKAVAAKHSPEKAKTKLAAKTPVHSKNGTHASKAKSGKAGGQGAE